MRLSTFIAKLQKIQKEIDHDPTVQVITSQYESDDKPGMYGGGGGGLVEKHHGSIGGSSNGIRLSNQYPDQLEIRTTK